MKRIAARYVYALDSFEPMKDGFVEYSDDGEILSTGISPDPEKEDVYLDGIIVPGFVMRIAT